MKTYVCVTCQLVTPLDNTGAVHRDGRRWCKECEQARLSKLDPDGPKFFEKEVKSPEHIPRANEVVEQLTIRTESNVKWKPIILKHPIQEGRVVASTGFITTGSTGITVSTGGAAPVIDMYNEGWESGWDAALDAILKLPNLANGGMALMLSLRSLEELRRNRRRS